MKSVKIILSVLGFAVTGLCCGPLFSQHNSDVLFYSSYYQTSNNRMEHRISQLPHASMAGDHFNTPVLSRTYFVPIEFSDIEPWMTVPFENSYMEEVLTVESWMTEPFENTYQEEELEVELWMTRPFEGSIAEDEVLMEKDLPVEDWMTKPFKAI